MHGGEEGGCFVLRTGSGLQSTALRDPCAQTARPGADKRESNERKGIRAELQSHTSCEQKQRFPPSGTVSDSCVETI